MKYKLLATTIALLSVAVAAFRYSRTAYESPDYEVQLEDGPFEIRTYPAMTLVSTPTDRRSASDEGFQRLFRYISGENSAEQKISMTTPVLMSETEDGGRMSFIAPREMAAEGAPAATNEQVRLETMEGGLFAAFRYSGRLNSARIDEAEQELLRWAEEQGLETVGEPIAAGYDPPFTPPMLRRNEILLRLAG